MRAPARQGVPPRTLPLLYFATAHVALALAFAFTAWWPHAAAGFFYHSWMVALVHLVTLGWISFSIFGAFYIVGPLALRTQVHAGRVDYLSFGLAAIGLIGMVAHFWIEQFSGMAWSAGTVAMGGLLTTLHIARTAWRAPIQAPVRLHVVLACVNFWLAATMGVLLGIHKATPFLPGFVVSNVFAHAHLAAIGWASMMVVGIAYGLLPRILPAKVPTGWTVYLSAVLLEVGVIGLFGTLMAQSPWSMVCGISIVAGFAVFAGHVVWMLRHLVTRPATAPRFDFAVAHAAAAGACLLSAIVIGTVILVVPMSGQSLHAAAAYGVLGLIGFLAQVVVAMETRLIPMAARHWMSDRDDAVIGTSPLHMRDSTLQTLVLAGWIGGVPTLAGGMALESAQLVAAGAVALFAATSVAAVDHVFLLIAPRPTGQR